MQGKKPQDCHTIFQLISAIRTGEVNPAELYKGTPMESVINQGAVSMLVKKTLAATRKH